MNADCCIKILRENLLLFLHEVMHEDHRFMQDYDPKHTSCKVKDCFRAESINWWKTPAEFPDLNPIENM